MTSAYFLIVSLVSGMAWSSQWGGRSKNRNVTVAGAVSVKVEVGVKIEKVAGSGS